MKNVYHLFVLIIATAFLVSCNQESSNVADATATTKLDPPVWTFNDDNVELGTTDFKTFDIELDYSKLKETVYTDPSKNVYVENASFNDEINITYNGDKATVDCGNTKDFTVKTDGANVTISTTRDVACNLKGKSQNGSLKILGDNKVRVNLNGVNLNCTNGPAINCQSSKMCYVVTDSASVLSDDSLYVDTSDDEKQKGCVCSRGYLVISGKAPLKIIANGSNAIHSSDVIFVRRGTNIDIDSRARSAIKAKNKVEVEGGIININSTGAGGHGIAAKKEVVIAGGRTTIISNTGLGRDGKNSRGIKSDSIVAITGGIVRVKESSVGGKGIRAGHKFLAKNCIVDVLTFGEDDKVTGSKNRGIKGADEINIDSARVRVRTENGWNEGLSSKRKIVISNSLVELSTRDDAISAGEEGVADITFNNARVYAESGMDAIDSNGTMHVNSGLFFLIAGSHRCRGFDCDFKEFKIGGEAIVVSLGEITSPPTADLLEHPMGLIQRPHTAPMFCLTTKNDNLVSFATPKFKYSDRDYRIFLSHPVFKENVSYDISSRANVKPKHTFHGLMVGGTATDKSVAERFSFSKIYQDFSTTVVPPYQPLSARNNPNNPNNAVPAATEQPQPQPTKTRKGHHHAVASTKEKPSAIQEKPSAPKEQPSAPKEQPSAPKEQPSAAQAT